jgi:hypothetical protein
LETADYVASEFDGAIRGEIFSDEILQCFSVFGLDSGLGLFPPGMDPGKLYSPLMEMPDPRAPQHDPHLFSSVKKKCMYSELTFERWGEGPNIQFLMRNNNISSSEREDFRPKDHWGL